MQSFIKNINTILDVLKKSFIELLPYMVLMSILVVGIQLITLFHFDAKRLQDDLVAFAESYP